MDSETKPPPHRPLKSEEDHEPSVARSNLVWKFDHLSLVKEMRLVKTTNRPL